MSDLPHLVAGDIERFEATLANLNERTAARSSIITDMAGFVVAKTGDTSSLDLSTLGALSANTYAASAAMAGLIGEPDFGSLYQEGTAHSLLISALGECALLVVIFDATISGGAVKHYAAIASGMLSDDLRDARSRAPDKSIDLSTMNAKDPSAVFRRQP